MPQLLLPVAFLAVAFLYSMAGFGGGSSYIALLAISGMPVASIPVLALSCNLIVSGQGSILLYRSGFVNLRLLFPLLAGSMPAAFVGGAWRLDSTAYLWILTVVLSCAGLALLFAPESREAKISRYSPVSLFLIGGTLGGIAGLSGIGGGIFLAPVLHFIRAEKAREIASAAAVFIALNSATGLIGQLSKGAERLGEIPEYLYLACPLAVLIGGRIGSINLSRKLSPGRVRRLTAAVVLIVAFRLWIRVGFNI